MNGKWWKTSLALALAGVLLAAVPALAQGRRGGGPRWQATQTSQDVPDRGPGYRNCPYYQQGGYRICPWGNTPQGPRGPRQGGRYTQPNPPANPQH